MPAKKPTLEQTIAAIIARDNGMPYSKVIEAFEISPNRFYGAVQGLRRIGDGIRFIGKSQVASKIASGGIPRCINLRGPY